MGYNDDGDHLYYSSHDSYLIATIVLVILELALAIASIVLALCCWHCIPYLSRRIVCILMIIIEIIWILVLVLVLLAYFEGAWYYDKAYVAFAVLAILVNIALFIYECVRIAQGDNNRGRVLNIVFHLVSIVVHAICISLVW